MTQYTTIHSTKCLGKTFDETIDGVHYEEFTVIVDATIHDETFGSKGARIKAAVLFDAEGEVVEPCESFHVDEEGADNVGLAVNSAFADAGNFDPLASAALAEMDIVEAAKTAFTASLV